MPCAIRFTWFEAIAETARVVCIFLIAQVSVLLNSQLDGLYFNTTEPFALHFNEYVSLPVFGPAVSVFEVEAQICGTKSI